MDYESARQEIKIRYTNLYEALIDADIEQKRAKQIADAAYKLMDNHIKQIYKVLE